jgi:cephalosporin-C deacetylase-like acetyl esterase
MKRALLVLLLVASTQDAQTPASADLDFLHGLSEYENIRRMLPDFIQRDAQAMVEARKRTLDVSSPDALARRRQFVRERILHAIGGPPERTPLNARVVETLQRDGYRIEKIIFESRPAFYVTANLYLPSTGRPPYPAVLYPLGHELGGKANPTWQQMLATLARKGYVALTWDPIGQGERVQLYDEDLQASKVRDSTTEHTIQGIQTLLTGHAIARYTIHDGLRALDYLLSRKEVDPKRIACTGNSGGGTHTAYLSALDDRIQVAAPSCYITSWHWMLKTIGPQDAEQVFPGWLADGLDYPDFLYAAAPKPYLVMSAIRDFFPIDGARETVAEARRTLASIGDPEKLKAFEADDGHGYSQPRRLAAYSWLSRWFHDSADNSEEAPVAPETAQTLFCTPTGQVATSLGGDTVFSINRARAESLRERRLHATGSSDFVAYQDKVRRAAIDGSGFRPASGEVPVKAYGVIQRSGYRIEKLAYESEPGILIPSLLYIPTSGSGRKPTVVFVDGAGKSAAFKAAEKLALAGSVVLSIDARGLGETRPGSDVNASEFYKYFGDYEDAMTGILMNRSLVGMRARDVLRGVDLLATRPEVDARRISGIGRGGGGAIPVLLAASFDGRLRSVALQDMLVSWHAAATTRMHRLIFEDVVPGALLDFDLPELVSTIAPRRVWIADPQSPTGIPVPHAQFIKEYAAAVTSFQLAGAPGALVLNRSYPGDEQAGEYYRDLLRE